VPERIISVESRESGTIPDLVRLSSTEPPSRKLRREGTAETPTTTSVPTTPAAPVPTAGPVASGPIPAPADDGTLAILVIGLIAAIVLPFVIYKAYREAQR
jgi:hypothetical protein